MQDVNSTEEILYKQQGWCNRQPFGGRNQELPAEDVDEEGPLNNNNIAVKEPAP